MGAACSSKKQQKTEQSQTIQNKRNGTPIKQEVCDPEKTNQMTTISKKFSGLLDLIGNIDQLPKKTRDQVNQLFVQRQNIDIITKNAIRKAMRGKGLMRSIQLQDLELVTEDLQFQKQLFSQLNRVAQIIEPLGSDADFENTFPILCVTFKDMAVAIRKL